MASVLDHTVFLSKFIHKIVKKNLILVPQFFETSKNKEIKKQF